MKERPILFGDAMVRAILDGRKTQTRQLMKPQPAAGAQWSAVVVNGHGGWVDGHGRPLRCPYGEPGDRLWARETHAIVPRTAYAASEGVQQILRPDDDHDAAVFRAGWERSAPGRWRPSIHMPRWASRILLEIVSVRVERLQDISETDAIAEGCDNSSSEAARECGWYEKPRRAFRRVWEQINGADAWDANPWVWVVEFRRIKQHEAGA